jgi:hypothetical protein
MSAELYIACACCGNMSGKTGEWHHFPKPERNGGDAVIRLCRSCHDWIDRTKLYEFSPEAFAGLFMKASTEERRVLYKLASIASDILKDDVA